MRKVSCNWIANAEKDLKWAKKMLEEGDYDYSSFHSQQAAEKALKALLIALRYQPPKTHSIEHLLNLIEKEGISVGEVEEAASLTDYAVEARYPDFEEEPTLEEAQHALETARRVVEWVKEKLEEMGVRCRQGSGL